MLTLHGSAYVVLLARRSEINRRLLVMLCACECVVSVFACTYMQMRTCICTCVCIRIWWCAVVDQVLRGAVRVRAVGAPACVCVCMRAHANVHCLSCCVSILVWIPCTCVLCIWMHFLLGRGGKYPNSHHFHAHFQHRRIVHVYVCIYMFVCACVCVRMHVLRAHVRVYHNPCWTSTISAACSISFGSWRPSCGRGEQPFSGPDPPHPAGANPTCNTINTLSRFEARLIVEAFCHDSNLASQGFKMQPDVDYNDAGFITIKTNAQQTENTRPHSGRPAECQRTHKVSLPPWWFVHTMHMPYTLAKNDCISYIYTQAHTAASHDRWEPNTEGRLGLGFRV